MHAGVGGVQAPHRPLQHVPGTSTRDVTNVTNVTLVVTIVELEGAFSVITNLRMDLFQALHDSGALAASSGRGLSSWTLGTCDTRHTHTQLGAPPCDQASCAIVIDEC